MVNAIQKPFGPPPAIGISHKKPTDEITQSTHLKVDKLNIATQGKTPEENKESQLGGNTNPAGEKLRNVYGTLGGGLITEIIDPKTGRVTGQFPSKEALAAYERSAQEQPIEFGEPTIVEKT